MSVTSIDRVRARIDRLPSALSIALVGVGLQVLLAVALLGLAYGGEDRVQLIVATILSGIVAMAVLAALPVLVLLYLDRYPRVAAGLAVIVAAGTVVLTEAHPTVLPLPAALLVAGVRAWAGAGLDAERIAEIDPDRLERVEPPRAHGAASSTEPDDDARPRADSDHSRTAEEAQSERTTPGERPVDDDRSTEHSGGGATDDERDYR